LQTKKEAQAKYELNQVLVSDPLGPYGAQAKKLLARYYP
jgi:hypothetical protein